MTITNIDLKDWKKSHLILANGLKEKHSEWTKEEIATNLSKRKWVDSRIFFSLIQAQHQTAGQGSLPGLIHNMIYSHLPKNSQFFSELVHGLSHPDPDNRKAAYDLILNYFHPRSAELLSQMVSCVKTGSPSAKLLCADLLKRSHHSWANLIQDSTIGGQLDSCLTASPEEIIQNENFLKTLDEVTRILSK